MKHLIFLLILLVAILLISCNSATETDNTPPQKGNIFLTSNPAGAQIWMGGVNTFKVTPDTIKDLDEGAHNVTLKLQEYRDTVFAVNVIGGQTSTGISVLLVSDIIKTLFGIVRLYENEGTSASEPSGLDLSTGAAYEITSAQNVNVDIYYSTYGIGGEPFLLQSADLYPNLIRETDFRVGSGNNLFDGEDSPDKNSGTWTDNIDDRDSNYVFLYDHDGHYSKIKIVSWGGGIPGVPKWIEIQWYYNNTALDNRF
jgi:hypothetical protein